MLFYEIGDTIRRYRKEKGLTQAALAKEAGITRQTLAKLERGLLPKISLASFVKILDALELEIEIEEKKPFYYFDASKVL